MSRGLFFSMLAFLLLNCNLINKGDESEPETVFDPPYYLSVDKDFPFPPTERISIWIGDNDEIMVGGERAWAFSTNYGDRFQY